MITWMIAFVIANEHIVPGDSFVMPRRSHRRQTMGETHHYMGKGFNRAKNKQAELAKKMAISKNEQQQQQNTAFDVDADYKAFKKLLSNTKGAIPTEMDEDSAFIAPITAGKIKQKAKKKPKPPEPSKKKAQEKETRVAQRIHFESLIDVGTSNVLGAIGAAKLVPWVPPFLTDCLIVFCDPRPSSGDLRQAFKYLTSNFQDDEDSTKATDQVVFISAESVEETRS